MSEHIVHVVARGADRRLLFTTHQEAGALWARLRPLVDARLGLVLMPDHLHLVGREARRQAIAQALTSFTLWRNRHRGESGPVFERHPPPSLIADSQHLRRTLRYLALNPLRKGLCRCPLEWPWSTHRDALGLSLDPVVERSRDPQALHDYVSRDHDAGLPGTPLPAGFLSGLDATPSLDDLMDTASALLRAPRLDLRRDRALRRRFIGLTRGFGGFSDAAIATFLGVHRANVGRVDPASPADLRLVRRALFDLRLGPLLDCDLRRTPAWALYAGRR
jgi:REP element-mobilizing transposase RayT